MPDAEFDHLLGPGGRNDHRPVIVRRNDVARYDEGVVALTANGTMSVFG
jgi:hypothetical protein